MTNKKLEQIAIEMGYSKEEFKDHLQQVYKKYATVDNSSEQIKYLMDISGIKPKKETIEKHTMKVLSNGSLCERNNLKRTKIQSKLPENKIHETYKKAFKENYLSKVQKLYEETKILPKFEELDINKIYNETFSKSNGLYWTKYLEKISKIKPKIKEELVSKKFMKEIKEYFFENAQELIDFWGKIPKLDNNKIQEWYLKEINAYSGNNFSHISKFRKMTQIEPERKMVQDSYLKLLKEKDTNSISKLKESTNIPPREKDVQRTYLEIIRNGDSQIGDIEWLEKASEIAPKIPKKEIELKHERELKQGRLYDFEVITKKFDILPTPEAIQMGYNAFIKNGNFEYMERLERMTGIKPSKKNYKTLIRKIME